MAPTHLTRGSPHEEPSAPPSTSTSSSLSNSSSTNPTEMDSDEINSNQESVLDNQAASNGVLVNHEDQAVSSVSSNTMSVPNSAEVSQDHDESEENTVSDITVNENTSSEDNSLESLKFSNESLERLDEMLNRTRWIVPVLPEQELQTLLRASIDLCSKGLDGENENCQKFMKESLSICFVRLMTDDAVKEWKPEIQRYIYDCAVLCINLCVLKLSSDDAPYVLDYLALIFNPKNKYHTFNSNKMSENSTLTLDCIETYARSPNYGQQKEKCWKYMQNVTDEELKKETKGDARENNGIEVVRYLRNLALCAPGRENIVRDLERLRLKTILRTLQMSSFAGKMNALNEINRVSSNQNNLSSEDSTLTSDELVKWMRENDLLGVAIKENLHILQYVEKLERIIRFMIKEKALTTQDLDQIWAAQVGKHDAIVKNVHDLLTKLAWDFTGEQLDHLFVCFQKSWREASKKQREKLLDLIRRLAEDDKEGQMADKVLKLLWNLARDSDISTDIMDQALQCHAKILDCNPSAPKEKDRIKLIWLEKTVEEIHNDAWILPALKHFRDICLQFSEPPANSSYPQWPSVTFRNQIVSQLQTEHSLVAVVTNSLCGYVEKMRKYVKANGANTLDVNVANLCIDGRFDHNTNIQRRLSFLKFLLRDGQLWLCEVQAKQIWDCLIVAPVFLSDREAGFRWFAKMMDDDADLDPQIWRTFFECKVLTLDPCLLTANGMDCFERFFKHTNQNEGRLMVDNSRFPHVNSFDMIGQEYLWRVVMQSGEQIAERAIDLIREVYGNPSAEMMEKLNNLHCEFISTCLERLRTSYDTLSFLANDKDKKDNVNQLRQETTKMTRVLRVLHGYVSSYDEQYNEERIHLPLYRACMGRTLTVIVQFQTQQGRPPDSMEFFTHSNETLGGFRRIVLRHVRAAPNVRVELCFNSDILERADDRKLLQELNFSSRMILQGKLQHGRSGNNGSSPDSSGESSADGSPQNEQLSRSEVEQMLPSTWMCHRPDVIDFLIQITELGMKLENDSLRDWARLVLRLIPGSLNLIEKITNLLKPQQPKLVAGALSNIVSNPTLNPLHGLFFSQPASEVVYCLELIYCQLVPAKDFENEQTVAFQKSFVQCDGLELCLAMLSQNNFLSQADASTKSTAFLWILRLLKVLLNVTAHVKLLSLESHMTRLKQQQQQASSPPNSVSVDSNELQGQMNVLQLFLTATVHDLLWKDMCKVWAEQLEDWHFKNSLELEHVKVILKIAWSSVSGNFSMYSLTSDEIHNACSPTKHLLPEHQDLCREALEVLPFCVGLVPSLIDPMTKEKTFQQCIVDLLFCSSLILRQTASEQFYTIATKSYQYLPKTVHFFLTLLFTVSNTKASECSQICREFFYLLRSLLNFAHSVGYQVTNLESLLDKEIVWLKHVREQSLSSLESYADDALLEGHLMVAKELVNFLEPSKKYYFGSHPNGHNLVKELLEDFLLPSSKMYVEQQKTQMIIHRSVTLMDSISTSSESTAKDSQSSNVTLPRSMTTIYSPSRCVPVCGTSQTINAAFDLIVSLCTYCGPNLSLVVQLLSDMFYNENASTITDWEYAPPVNLRNTNMFVGLKNAGATCYMNSVLQQLFTIEPLRNAVLNADPNNFELDDSDNEDQQQLSFLTSAVAANVSSAETSATTVSPSNKTPVPAAPSSEQLRKEYHVGVMRCVQLIFANLLGSQLQYYVPKKFWKHFKFIMGEPINLREQHDALEFFNKVVDSIDEALKSFGEPEMCSKIFGGTFADQKICQGCPHSYTREEAFNTLSLDVRNQNNLLESLQEYVKGDLLESENAYFCEKCNKKVDAIKRLCIKKLPPILAIQLKRFDFDWEREAAVKFQDYFAFPREINMKPYTVEGLSKQDGGVEVVTDGGEVKKSHENESTHYTLRGIVVHSGQANGGHYFSFILHKFPNGTSKWYKFDDGDVSECRMDDDEELKAQCFGGEYSVDTYDQYYRRMQKRTAKRWWNAYILFYERTDSEEISLCKTTESMSLSTRLRQMPTRLETIVRRKNMKSVHERNQFSPEYFMFMRNLSLANIGYLRKEAGDSLIPVADGEKLALLSVTILSHFLFSTGFHAKRTLHVSMQDWPEILMMAFRFSFSCRIWFAQEILFKHPTRFTEYMLESTSSEVRHSFGKILMNLAHFSHNDPVTSIKCLSERQTQNCNNVSDVIILTVLFLLRKDVADNARHFKEYFMNLYAYANLGVAEKKQLLVADVPAIFIRLASDGNETPMVRSYMGDHPRLLSVISLLIRCCDVSEMCKSAEENSVVPANPYAEIQPPIMKIQTCVVKLLYDSNKYIKKLVDEPMHMDDTAKLLKFCCFENWSFSQSLIEIFLHAIRSSFTELRPVLELLLCVLTVNDSWTEKRNILALKGTDSMEGVFKMLSMQMSHQARRCYQVFKALTGLFPYSQAAVKVLHENDDLKRIWLDASAWLNNELSKKSYPSQYNSLQWTFNQSNEGGSGIGLSRTPSARTTLNHAKSIAKDHCQLPSNENPFGENEVRVVESSAKSAVTPQVDDPPPEYTHTQAE